MLEEIFKTLKKIFFKKVDKEPANYWLPKEDPWKSKKIAEASKYALEKNKELMETGDEKKQIQAYFNFKRDFEEKYREI